MMKSMVALSLGAAVAFPMTGCYLQDMIENVDGFEVGSTASWTRSSTQTTASRGDDCTER